MKRLTGPLAFVTIIVVLMALGTSVGNAPIAVQAQSAASASIPVFAAGMGDWQIWPAAPIFALWQGDEPAVRTDKILLESGGLCWRQLPSDWLTCRFWKIGPFDLIGSKVRTELFGEENGQWYITGPDVEGLFTISAKGYPAIRTDHVDLDGPGICWKRLDIGGLSCRYL